MADKLDEWERGESIGEGGQARTFKAYREGENKSKTYIMKVLKNKSSPSRLKRFEQEINVGLRLSHPNVIKIEGHNIEHQYPYVVTEYCSGNDLDKADISRFSIGEKLKLFAAICRGVGYAHKQGVIHRDIKPNNIFLREDMITPVIGDFGLCLLTEQDHRVTETLEVVGGRWFMAPELEDGRYEDATPIADVYSLGKLIYWLISNKKVFNREKHRLPQYDLTKISREPAILFIYDLLDRMLISEPEQRKYEDANAVAGAVEKIMERISMNAHPIGLMYPQLCSYCAVGTYQKLMQASGQNDPHFDTMRFNVGIDLLRIPATWLIMACDYCGNVQFFRTDIAKNKGIWTEETPV